MAKKPETSKELESALERIMSPDFPAGKLPKATLDDVRKDALAMTTSHDTQPTPVLQVREPYRREDGSWASEIDDGMEVFGIAYGKTASIATQYGCAFASAPALAEENARLKAENTQLRESLANANNIWRHEFSSEVDAAAEKLFKRLSWNNTVRAALAPEEPEDAAD